MFYGDTIVKPRTRRSSRLRVPFEPYPNSKDRAKQSFKKDCDINVLMSGYMKGGTVDHLLRHGANYGDFSPVSFHEAMNCYAKVSEMFEDLPSEVRKRFSQDPKGFLEFVQARDDKGALVNLEEMRKLKLAPPPTEAPEPIAVTVANAEDLRGPGAAAPGAP